MGFIQVTYARGQHMQLTACSATALLPQDLRSSHNCCAELRRVLHQLGASTLRSGVPYGHHELLPYAAEDPVFRSLEMGTRQQPICSVGFADMWDLFPWHESGHTILSVIIKILFGRFPWKGDTMCGKGKGRKEDRCFLFSWQCPG